MNDKEKKYYQKMSRKEIQESYDDLSEDLSIMRYEFDGSSKEQSIINKRSDEVSFLGKLLENRKKYHDKDYKKQLIKKHFGSGLSSSQYKSALSVINEGLEFEPEKYTQNPDKYIENIIKTNGGITEIIGTISGWYSTPEDQEQIKKIKAFEKSKLLPLKKQYSKKDKVKYFQKRINNSKLTKNQRKYAKNRLRSLLQINKSKAKKVSKNFVGNGIQKTSVRKITKQKNGKFKVDTHNFENTTLAKRFNNMANFKEYKKLDPSAPRIIRNTADARKFG